MVKLSILVALQFCALASAGSPVQKVVELLGECKAKVLADVEAEKTAMTEYSSYCDDEAKEKGYAIETAARSIEDLSATIESNTASSVALDDEVSTLGGVIAGKEKELADATAARKAEHDDFVAAEKELVETVDQLSRAAAVLKKGASLAQTRGGHFHVSKQSQAAINALSTIVESQWVDSGSRKTLQAFIQAKSAAEDSDDDDDWQPQAKKVVLMQGEGIVQTVEDMQGKAEDTLSEVRKKEMEASHGFQLVNAGLLDELENAKGKVASASSSTYYDISCSLGRPVQPCLCSGEATQCCETGSEAKPHR